MKSGEGRVRANESQERKPLHKAAERLTRKGQVRCDNESDGKEGQLKVCGRLAPYVSYHRSGRNSARMRNRERRVRANGSQERAPHRGLCALSKCFSLEY